MTDIVWGDPIAVDGKRPEWLSGRQVAWLKTSLWTDPNHGKDVPAERWSWRYSDGLPCITSLRLPADHFAYTAIAAGFVPWGGGDEAPADYDPEGGVLFGNGDIHTGHGWAWGRDDDSPVGRCLIIGYRRRAEQPAGYVQLAACRDNDTVTIARMTEAQWRSRPSGWAYDVGLIREPTEAERIAADTGIALADVERVLAARG